MYGSSGKAARRAAKKREEGWRRSRESIEEKAREVPFGSFRFQNASGEHALQAFFLFRPDHRRKFPSISALPSIKELHRLRCYIFSVILAPKKKMRPSPKVRTGSASDKHKEGKKFSRERLESMIAVRGSIHLKIQQRLASDSTSVAARLN